MSMKYHLQKVWLYLRDIRPISFTYTGKKTEPAVVCFGVDMDDPIKPFCILFTKLNEGEKVLVHGK